MGDKVFIDGYCDCPGNKENPFTSEEFQHDDGICACPPNMVDDGTGTHNCVTGNPGHFGSLYNRLALCKTSLQILKVLLHLSPLLKNLLVINSLKKVLR